MIRINKVHHIAIICSDYEKSKAFYTEVLGFDVQLETFRKERASYKCDLSLHGKYTIELFSFPNPPKRATRPEGTGLRHLAFEVDNVKESAEILANAGIKIENVRLDESTKKKFVFFSDPDDLPLELYEK